MKEKDKSPQWKDNFDNNFRNLAKQIHTIFYVIKTLQNNLAASKNHGIEIKEYKCLNHKILKKATEIFDNTFCKTLDRTNIDITDEDKKS